jgi:hypothetical protein
MIELSQGTRWTVIFFLVHIREGRHDEGLGTLLELVELVRASGVQV